MTKHVLDATKPTMPDPDPRIHITPGGLYITVGGLPTECMFSGGSELVDLRLDRDVARHLGEWLIAQATK